MIWFQYYIEKNCWNKCVLPQTNTYCYEELGVLEWTIHTARRWWARIGPDTDGQRIKIFSFNIPLYIAPWASNHAVNAIHIDNTILQYIDNSTHIATSINISSGSIRIDEYCSDILAFQYHIDDILGEVLIHSRQYSKRVLPSTIGVTALNYSILKKTIQYVLPKATYLIWQYVLKVLKTTILPQSICIVPTIG